MPSDIVEINSNQTTTSTDNDVQDIVQENIICQREQERVFQQVLSWMRNKVQALYEQVDRLYNFTASLKLTLKLI